MTKTEGSTQTLIHKKGQVNRTQMKLIRANNRNEQRRTKTGNVKQDMAHKEQITK